MNTAKVIWDVDFWLIRLRRERKKEYGAVRFKTRTGTAGEYAK